MITDTIKELLGEELVAQVEAALKGKGKDGKDVDLRISNDGRTLYRRQSMTKKNACEQLPNKLLENGISRAKESYLWQDGMLF